MKEIKSESWRKFDMIKCATLGLLLKFKAKAGTHNLHFPQFTTYLTRLSWVTKQIINKVKCLHTVLGQHWMQEQLNYTLAMIVQVSETLSGWHLWH